MIDLDQIGPDWELAKIHAQSTVAGKAPGGINEVERCPCCFRKVITEPIGLFSNSKELEVLGFAYPLYFKFLKYAMILILFQICSYNILQLTNSINQNQQQCSVQGQILNTVCSNFLVGLASLNTQITRSQRTMRICSFAIHLFLLIYIRHKMTNTLKYYRQRKTTISNYSILIKDLPEVPEIKSKIKKIFKEYFYGDYETEEIILIGFLSEYYDLKDKKQEILRKKLKIMDGEIPDYSALAQCDDKIAEIQQLIDREVENTIDSTKKDQLRCQKVIVILQSQSAKETVIRDFQRFLKKPEKRKKLKQILGSEDIDYIRMQEAPQPNEIIWSHINVPRKKRRIKQILGWVFTFLFMAAITAVFYFIIREKSNIVKHLMEILNQQSSGEDVNASSVRARAAALVYFFIFAIVLLNKLVISQFLHLISNFQKHPTYSKEEYFFSIKYTITIFLTTAVLTLLVEDATLHNIYQEEYGIIVEESIMFFISAIFVPFLWLVNPFQVSKLIKRKINYGKHHLTQGEANNLMMDAPASLGKLFAETIEIIWFTYMYSSVIPLGGILVLGGFMGNYWIVKNNILKRSSIDNQVSGRFITMALALLDISLIMKPVGELIFDIQIRNGYTVESIICTIIGLIYCFLPMNFILQYLHKEQFLLSQKTYQQSKSNFATSYQMLHPIYSLSKIYIEKQTQKLNIYTPTDAIEQRRPTKKLAINIEMALLRRSSQFKLQSKILPKKEEIIVEQPSFIQNMGESNIHQRIL